MGKLTEEFVETTTIHGIAEIYASTSKTERICYAIALACAFVMTLYGIVNIVVQYVESPVATSYFIQGSDSLTLPDITICPFNRLNHKLLKSYGASKNLAKFIELAFFMQNPSYDFMKQDVGMKRVNRTALQEEMLELMAQRFNDSFDLLMMNISLSCSDLIVHCEQYYKAEECCEGTEEVLTSVGNCFRIHGIQQHAHGFGNGLTVMIKLPLELYGTSETMLANDGVLVKLTEPGKGYEYDSVFVPPGTHALMQLQATKHEFINDPPRHTCMENAHPDYATFICYQTCLLDPILPKCNCSYAGFSFDTTSEHRFCQPQEVIKCVYTALQLTYQKSLSFAEDCQSKCAERCSFWKYTATVSYADYPAPQLTKPYFSAADMADLEASGIVLELFFDKLEYTVIEHSSSMTADTFISNVGGQMGLWMGCSIVSVIHVIIFLFSLAKDKLGLTKQQVVNFFLRGSTNPAADTTDATPQTHRPLVDPDPNSVTAPLAQEESSLNSVTSDVSVSVSI